MASTLARSARGRGGGKNLVCGVCREVYRSPRFLPCYHTFCLHCLEGLVRSRHGRTFPCPSCRKTATVPPDGALGFQVNFYITEEELERERRGPNTAMCARHKMEELVFFCRPCDRAICIRCKLTKHSEHPDTEDLSEAAARCTDRLENSKQRLENTISYLSRMATEAQKNLTAAKEKGVALKEQVQLRHDALVRRIGAVLEEAMAEISASNTALEKKLTQDVQKIQNELDVLVRLQQRVHRALRPDASDADKVYAEKEMRDGKGSEASLQRIKEGMPATTSRPGVHFASDLISDDHIRRALGDPVPLSLPFGGSNDVIVPILQFTEREQKKEVYGLSQVNSENVVVLRWDPSSGKTIRSFIYGNKRSYNSYEDVIEGQISYQRYKQNRYFRSTRKFHCHDGTESYRFNSKGLHTKMFQVVHESEKTSIFRTEVKSGEPLQLENTHILNTNHTIPSAFDTSDSGRVIALVENHSFHLSPADTGIERRVCLYHNDHSSPFATYTPEDSSFYPSDVCFWRENDQEKLLVADRQNDCVHVVSILEDEVRFERYLAAGDSRLVRPTALNVDDQGRVLIGCENGSALRCETQETESQLSDNESDEISESGVSVLSADSVSDTEGSELALGLTVENASRSTQSSSQSSENGTPLYLHL
ncbi:uncharacterized protein LOC143284132 [Babylonia areolata]|uniref:uncharacterized protein LOC143284132 n=1 Tax=Babylonia areolata TaxID=304850 RepID=UPI003FCEF026